MRGTEKVAVDVIRGHQGTRIQATKFDQKAWDTFYYNLKFDATQLQCYFRAMGSTSFNLNEGAQMVNGIAAQQKMGKDMIERAIELHCANIFETGTCTSLQDGSIVDFKRQAASMVTKTSGNYWTDSGVDPYADLKAGGDFLRQVGKSNSYDIYTIWGAAAWTAFRSNTVATDRLKQFNNMRDMLPPSMQGKTGEIYQGFIDVDSYKIHVFTYNDFYDDPTGGSSMIAYKNPKSVVMIGGNEIGNTLYGATPQLSTPGASTLSLTAGEYFLWDYIDVKSKSHDFHIESAPLPVPIKVDRIYTLTPVA
jgi:hypothetical protein